MPTTTAAASGAASWQALTRAGAGDSIAALAAHPQARVELLVDALGTALADREEPIVLVLDDFHEVAETVHADIDLLLRLPAPALRIVIATRSDPPLHLGRLRLQDQLAELRVPDLALTLPETSELLAGLGLALDDEHVQRLWERTEGWVGAVRLAALSLRDHPEPERFVDDFAGDDRAISDYLLTEVMSTLTPDDRCFLLRTAVAGVLNGDLANALTDRNDGHRRLGELARGAALISPLDRRGEWYRYHALFRELLMAELRSGSPEQVPELHRRAAKWLADHGDDARGLLHAVEGEAWDLAARLAGERWVELLIRGEIGALRPLIERMPLEWALADPEVALAVASALLDRGDERAAEARVRSAEAAADRVAPERRAHFDVALNAIRLHVARLRGDLDGTLDAARELAQRGSLEHGVVEADLRALALTNLGIAELWAGEAGEAALHLERARNVAADAGHAWLVLIAVAHLALLASIQDDSPRSARHGREAIELAGRHGWERTWPAGGAYLALASADFRADRLEEAGESLERARDALAATRERPLRAALALVRSGILASRGELERALAVLTAGADELGDWPLLPALRDQFHAREAALRAELGERAQAKRLLLGDNGHGPRSLPAAVVLAQLQLGDGETAAARATLAPFRAELETSRTPPTVQGWLVDALALDAVADHAGAAASLEQALERAEPSGLRWALLGFGRSLQPLLRRQLRTGTAHRALVGELLDALDPANGDRRPAVHIVVEPLSPRERAVLRYLPTMMSNQEIAAELFVSVNTVKTHLKAIYRKLDVPDRREAVRRARALELLAP